MLNRLEPRQNKIEQGPLINNLRLHSGTVLPVCIMYSGLNLRDTKFRSTKF